MHHVLPLSLERRQPGRIRPDLASLGRVLDNLHRPQQRFRSILIVGTNGKGSVAAMLTAILERHGVRCGTYTSPHLVRVEERIRTAGKPIARTRLERHLRSLDRYPDLTFFEVLTAAAFLAFADDGVEVAVLEAGMGGRWDATRLAQSAIAGLTNVGSDHAAWLGPGRTEIAADKGAALAAARLAVVGPEVDEPTRQLLGVSDLRRAADIAAVRQLDPPTVELRVGTSALPVILPLAGRHQLANLSLATALAVAAGELEWSPTLDLELVREAIAAVRWPGRLTEHRIAGRTVLVDCAHNRESAAALAAELGSRPSRYNLVFSCLDDKPVEAMASMLRPLVDRVAICPLDDERAMPVKRLRAAFPDASVAADPIGALHALPDPVLGAGSLRLVGALLRHAEEELA